MTSAVPKHPVVIFKDGLWENRRKTRVTWKLFTFVIPIGYRCNLGSVPWLFQPIVKPTGKGNLGFLCHDFAYDDDQESPVGSDGIPMDREAADEMMRDLLIYSGLAKWRAMVAWRGVRRGGWLSWKKAD